MDESEFAGIFEEVKAELAELNFAKRSIRTIVIRFEEFAFFEYHLKVQGSTVKIEINDLMLMTDRRIIRSLAFIILCKACQITCPWESKEPYLEWLRKTRKDRVFAEEYLRRKQDVILNTAGEIYNLDKVFDAINQMFFSGYYQKPALGWSRRKLYNLFGYYSPYVYAIVISRVFDTPRIPRFVLDYIMYHEMLHIRHDTEKTYGRRNDHPTEFLLDERKFPKYAEAEDWLKKIAKSKGRGL